MVYFEPNSGDNDFASLFPSLRQERDNLREKEQTEMLLKILSELEQTGTQSAPSKGKMPVENNVAISGDGDIVRTEELFNGKRLDRRKTYTLDDLPRESEWEAMFGPQPEPAELKVSTGLRIKDGKKYYRAGYKDGQSYFAWTNLNHEALLFILAALCIVLVVLLVNSKRRKRTNRFAQQLRTSPASSAQQVSVNNNESLQRMIDAQVQDRVKHYLSSLSLRPSDFA